MIQANELHNSQRLPDVMLTLQHLYTAYDVTHRPPEPERLLSTMQHFCKRRRTRASLSAFDRINQCRRGLEALDRQGWLRSYHQRQFHEQFIRACARIFYKTEPPGTFQRDHQRLLQVNGWTNLSQEILISTPRRCECIYLEKYRNKIDTQQAVGKTISVSLFAAAILFSAPRVELSIYSTCKRISQKLLRNVKKFLDLIYTELDVHPFKIVRSNCEELMVLGPESSQDIRMVNSYPSKVRYYYHETTWLVEPSPSRLVSRAVSSE